MQNENKGNSPSEQETRISGPHIVIYMDGDSLQMRSSFQPDQTQLILVKMLFMTLSQSTKPASPIVRAGGPIPGN